MIQRSLMVTAFSFTTLDAKLFQRSMKQENIDRYKLYFIKRNNFSVKNDKIQVNLTLIMFLCDYDNRLFE